MKPLKSLKPLMLKELEKLKGLEKELSDNRCRDWRKDEKRANEAELYETHTGEPQVKYS